MNAQAPIATQSGVPSASEMAQIAAIAYSDAGIVINQDKTSMVQSRLTKRLRSMGLTTYASYLALVSTPEGAAERQQMISSLTTNVSHFFRESHHFTTLRNSVFPDLLSTVRRGGRARIWSAGCSNGQEAYSIAMTATDMMPDIAERDFRILATDIDPIVVKTGKAATYDTATVEPVAPALRAKFMEKNGDNHRLITPIRSLVNFQELNLHAAWPMRGQFDVIFCRNVVIYFDPPTQMKLWKRFAASLAPGGWLFVGHSERVPVDAGLGFETAGITTYRLKGAIES